jgi:uncharacterized protein YjbJ (UPF0337 family)
MQGIAAHRAAGASNSRHLWVLSLQPAKEGDMNKDHLKGAADKTKGAVKDAVGGLTGDDKLQAEGKLDKAKGAVHDAVGNAKDAVKRAVDD